MMAGDPHLSALQENAPLPCWMQGSLPAGEL